MNSINYILKNHDLRTVDNSELPEDIQKDIQRFNNLKSMFLAYKNGQIVYAGYEENHLKDGRHFKIDLDFVIKKVQGLICNDPLFIINIKLGDEK